MFRAYVQEPSEPPAAPETNRTLIIGLVVVIAVLVVLALLLVA